MRAAIDKIGNWLPQGYGDAARQLSLFVVAELCYEAVRGVADGQRAIALANGQHVISFEKSIHAFFEPEPAEGVHRSPLDHRLRQLHVHEQPLRGDDRVPRLALPLQEPELLLRAQHVHGRDGTGGRRLRAAADRPPAVCSTRFTDTITQYAQVNHDSGLVKLFINPYAAIPSMHVAFSTMIGVTGVLISRHTITKIFWCAYPVLVFWVVIVTANHFWVDGAFGLLVAVLSALAARQVLARVRPAALVLAASNGLSARDALRRYGEPALVAAALGVGVSDRPAGQRRSRRPDLPVGPVREPGAGRPGTTSGSAATICPATGFCCRSSVA